MIEMYEAYRGLARIIHELDPMIPLLLKGMSPHSLTKEQEFLTFEVLDEREKPSQTIINSDKCLSVQLTCYSYHAEFRTDKKIDRPQELAAKYKKLFHRANHIIKSTCVRMHDARIVYLDLRSAGDSVNIAVQANITQQLHCCVIQSEAYIQ